MLRGMDAAPAATPLLGGQRQARASVRMHGLAAVAALAAVVLVCALAWRSSSGAAEPTALLPTAPCGLALAGSPCLPGGMPALYGSDPMGPEVNRLASSMKALRGKLDVLRSQTTSWASSEAAFVKNQHVDLSDIDAERLHELKQEQDEAAFLNRPGPAGPQGLMGFMGVPGAEGGVGPVGPAGYMGHEGAQGIEGRCEPYVRQLCRRI